MEVFSTAKLDSRTQAFDSDPGIFGIKPWVAVQILQKCTFDIASQMPRIDIDVWFPGQKRYIETHTADYMTDYQARDLKTRVRAAEDQSI